MSGFICAKCKYFIKPSWWERLALGIFAERCGHEDCVDEIDGTSMACITARIGRCTYANPKFEAR
jgi:hypothetical protein